MIDMLTWTKVCANFIKQMLNTKYEPSVYHLGFYQTATDHDEQRALQRCP